MRHLEYGPSNNARLSAGVELLRLTAALIYLIDSSLERASKMAKVGSYHSAKLGTRVHHNDNKCTEGNNIESYNRRTGTGGHPLCDHCRRL